MRLGVIRWSMWGAAAWSVYGCVEIVLATGVQLWRDPEKEILAWQWRWMGLLLGGYGFMGLVLGAAGAFAWRSLRRDLNPEAARIFATWTVALAFAANVAFGFAGRWYEILALAVALAAAAALASALISQRRRKTFRFLAEPWSATLLLLGPPWISMEALGRAAPASKAAVFVAFLAAVAVLAVLVERLRKGGEPAIRRPLAAAAALFGIFAAAVLASPRGPLAQAAAEVGVAPSESPNVVFIVMDTVRADHTSLYGYQRDTTPHLRELARQSTLYSHVVATSDFTLPTHASMFTGVYPEWHGAFRQDGESPLPLRPGRPTLAELLRGHGYWTAGAVANFAYLAPWSGLIRGFAVTVTGKAVNLARAQLPFYLLGLVRRLLRLAFDVSPLEKGVMTAADVEPRARALLERAQARGGPFFVFVNYMDAHYPYIPDAPFNAQFPGKGAGLEPAIDARRQTRLDEHPLSPGERAYLVSQYDGGIAEEDASIGRLIDRLRQLGCYDNTLIVVTADHGEAFGERQLLEHDQGFVYQDLVGVPLLIKYPHQRSAARVEALVSQVDLMPTILKAANIPAPSGLQGIDLLSPEGARDRNVYSAASSPQSLAGLNPRFAGTRRAIFAGSLKLIASTTGPPELYDLAADPNEERDLYSAGDPRAADLLHRLDAWAQTMPHENARPAALDPGVRERLKSLGYVQ
ncbi:MAG TPA: sulfatase [Bryobacteraceae bacterium]|nr:sulfatase [Bryobacteraceae bacterium]